MIDYKSLNLFLLFVLALLLFLLYSLNNRQLKETFEDNMNSSMNPDFLNNGIDEGKVDTPVNIEANKSEDENSNTSLESMFESLEKAEIFCDDMERREKTRENETRANIHQIAKDQLESQKKRINELKSVLEFLKQELRKRKTISDKCRANTQTKLNKDTKLVKKLTEAGMIPNEKTKVEVKISDDLQKIVDSIKNAAPEAVQENFTNALPAPRFTSNQCPHIDTRKYVHVSELGKCLGCSASELVKNINYINRDFE